MRIDVHKKLAAIFNPTDYVMFVEEESISSRVTVLRVKVRSEAHAALVKRARANRTHPLRSYRDAFAIALHSILAQSSGSCATPAAAGGRSAHDPESLAHHWRENEAAPTAKNAAANARHANDAALEAAARAYRIAKGD